MPNDIFIDVSGEFMHLKANYDVIVVGGGISGAMAAVAAGRQGASVLVVEQYGFLGGMLTAAGVGPMMTFHAGNVQVIKGITGDLIERLTKRGKSPGHIYDTTKYTYTVTPFDLEGMKYELDTMLIEANVSVLFHTMLASVSTVEDKIDKIQVCNKAGLSSLKASVYIDATGDGDLSMWAGVDTITGRDGDCKCQPVTMKMRMVNVDVDAIRSYIKTNPLDFPTLNGDTASIDKGSRLSIGGFLDIVRKAREAGEFNIDRHSVLIFEANNPGEVIINTSRIFGYDPTKPTDLSEAEMKGREQVHVLEKFLKKWMPGFKNSMLAFSGPSIGVRSSRQIVGLYRLTADDILAFKKFDDSIAFAGYPIDIHPVDGEVAENYSPSFAGGHYYGIPYRCLVNPNITNLITVGRCISATFEAQGAIRTTPTMGAVGHAGGAAAAIASRKAIPAADVPLDKLKTILRGQGAFLG